LKNAARKTALNERGGDGGDLARFDEIRRAPAPGVGEKATGWSGVVDGRVGVGEGGGVDESSLVTRMGKFFDRAAPTAFKGAQCGSGV
jgi:hypothetical protein